jgi:hypothetical protein
MDTSPSVDIAVQIGRPKLRQPFGLTSTRCRWTHVPGIAVAALAYIVGALAFATEPWAPSTNMLASIPILSATILLTASADLMLRPKRPWSRFRDAGVMQSGLLAITVTLILCVLTDDWLAWPVLYPLFLLPIALPLVGFLGMAPFSRLQIDTFGRVRIIAGSLITSAIMLAIAAHPFQHQVATQWTR